MYMQSIQKPLNLIIRIVKSKRLLATYQARREHSAPILKNLALQNMKRIYNSQKSKFIRSKKWDTLKTYENS